MSSLQAIQKTQAADIAESSTRKKSPTIANLNETSLPAYDTLSLAPSSVSDQDQTSTRNQTRESSISKLKQKYQALKEENTQRKAERVKCASTEDIDRLTACTEDDKRRSEGKNAGDLTNGRNFVGKSIRIGRTSAEEIDADCPRHVYAVRDCSKRRGEIPRLR